MRLTNFAGSLLWIDCTAGLLAGTLALILAPWLSELYELSIAFVRGMGIANAAYGSFSLSLARRAARPPILIATLVFANAAWAVFCGVAAVVMASRISGFGLAVLIFEGLFVGGLAVLEWRYRARLAVGE